MIPVIDRVSILINASEILYAFVTRDDSAVIFVDHQSVYRAEMDVIVTSVLAGDACCKHDRSEADAVMISQRLFEEIVDRWRPFALGHCCDVLLNVLVDAATNVMSDSIEAAGVVAKRLLHRGMQLRVIKEIRGMRQFGVEFLLDLSKAFLQ